MATKSAAQEMLRQALKEAFYKAAVKDHSRNGILVVEPNDFVRQFLYLWMYGKNLPFTGDSRSAYGSFFIIFQKNHSVTNITCPDCVTLVGKHCKSVVRGGSKAINFMSNSQYVTAIIRTIFFTEQALIFENESNFKKYIKARISICQNFYFDLFAKTVIINFYFTSANLHIPTTLRLDLDRIVFESGYIHSVGHNVYLRKAEAADYSTLLDNLRQFIATYKPKPGVYLAPYSDEFFPEYPKDDPYSTRNGLDGIKISARKHHIGDKSVLDLLSALVSDAKIGEHVSVPQSAKFVSERREAKCDKDISIFLCRDYGLRYSKTQRALEKSDEMYVFCYAQFLRNDNQLHIFKERKPAWSGPITLPHTLAGAISNVTLKRMAVTSARVVLDPFCGTGTNLLEVALRDSGARLIGIDRDPLVPQMIRDNLDFFAGEAANIWSSVVSVLKSFDKEITIATVESELSRSGAEQRSVVSPHDKVRPFLRAACTVIKEVLRRSKLSKMSDIRQMHLAKMQNDGFDAGSVSKLTGLGTLFERLSFYLVWRALSLGSFRFHSNAGALLSVVKNELETFEKEVYYLKEAENRNRIRADGTMATVQGDFSRHVQIDTKFFSGLKSELVCGNEAQLLKAVQTSNLPRFGFYSVRDSIAMLKSLSDSSSKGIKHQGFVDAVFTDPPYGFNTTEGGDLRLEKLFSDLPAVAVRILKAGGVCSIVLPAFSRNGKQIAYFETKDVFVRQFVAQCQRYGRRIVSVSESLPETIIFPKLPYRWISENGVSRHVLSFTVE
jgi:tRNA G10  N-methylase Trm11